jgi:hypothetical protein
MVAFASYVSNEVDIEYDVGGSTRLRRAFSQRIIEDVCYIKQGVVG